MASKQRLTAALERIKRWMIDHDAPLLVENLAHGASAADLDEAEAALGFALPPGLRELWTLHNGQKEEMNGFVEFRDLFDTHCALAEREKVVEFVEFLREYPDDWVEAGVTAEEVQSNRWVPIAGRDMDLLVVSGVSGRVFSCEKDAPPLHLVAKSLSEWAEQYAARVEADDYAVEEGFGDYYLALRDRDAEQRELEREREHEEDERYRRETPLLTQLRDALSREDAERCRDVFEAAASAPAGDLLPQAVELLFSTTTEPEFIATALQFVLMSVTLAPARWATVAKGGELLENNAIRDIAARRARS